MKAREALKNQESRTPVRRPIAEIALDTHVDDEGRHSGSSLSGPAPREAGRSETSIHVGPGVPEP